MAELFTMLLLVDVIVHLATREVLWLLVCVVEYPHRKARSNAGKDLLEGTLAHMTALSIRTIPSPVSSPRRRSNRRWALGIRNDCAELFGSSPPALRAAFVAPCLSRRARQASCHSSRAGRGWSHVPIDQLVISAHRGNNCSLPYALPNECLLLPHGKPQTS